MESYREHTEFPQVICVEGKIGITNIDFDTPNYCSLTYTNDVWETSTERFFYTKIGDKHFFLHTQMRGYDYSFDGGFSQAIQKFQIYFISQVNSIF